MRPIVVVKYWSVIVANKEAVGTLYDHRGMVERGAEESGTRAARILRQEYPFLFDGLETVETQVEWGAAELGLQHKREADEIWRLYWVEYSTESFHDAERISIFQ